MYVNAVHVVLSYNNENISLTPRHEVYHPPPPPPPPTHSPSCCGTLRCSWQPARFFFQTYNDLIAAPWRLLSSGLHLEQLCGSSGTNELTLATDWEAFTLLRLKSFLVGGVMLKIVWNWNLPGCTSPPLRVHIHKFISWVLRQYNRRILVANTEKLKWLCNMYFQEMLHGCKTIEANGCFVPLL